jgi:hypothetical protein
MPLTSFQSGVARLLAANRNPESYVAGGAVINRGEAGLRLSDDLRAERLVRPVELGELKRQWLEARARAERLVDQLPAEALGCLYLNAAGTPMTPEPAGVDFAGLTRHFGCVRGAWPTIS